MENNLAAILMSQASLKDPVRYAKLMEATNSKEILEMKERLPEMKKQLEVYEQTAKQAEEFRKQVSGEGYAVRRKDSKKIFGGLDQQEAQSRGPVVDMSVILSTHYASITRIYSVLVEGATLITSSKMVSFDAGVEKMESDLSDNVGNLGESRLKALMSKASEARNDALQSLELEQRLNLGSTTNFIQGLACMEKIPKMYEDYLASMSRLFEAYYERLRYRHSNGMVIVNYGDNPSVTLTDVSLLVWGNIDRVGEIEDGHDSNEITAFTLHRAHAMIEAAKASQVWPWVVDPGSQLMGWAKNALGTVVAVRKFVIDIKQGLGESTWRLVSTSPQDDHDNFIDVVESLDLSQISQRPPERAFSKTERFAMNHKNDSIQKVADMLVTGDSFQTIVDEIIRLKIEEHSFFVNENSFYVCKIGTGNPFAGEAPGAIEVFPGERPNVNLNKVWGGGFDEIRDFIRGMQVAKDWSPLFLSTSPSGSTDKANVLLVGPQGCGKSMVLRSLASKYEGADGEISNDSISIFLVGSDLLTCWRGEEIKNPKRLFEEAIKLHKSSGKNVRILIDEIDAVLNKDTGPNSGSNLSLEFQNVMDGVVAYPGVSVWGATNHPEKIPTPMLRRFAKVLIVGELQVEDSVTILKHYTETFLPCDGGFSDEQYLGWAEKLSGATGDVIRKAIDEVWLKLMRDYVRDHEDKATLILDFIKESYGEQFSVSELTQEDRETIKNMVGEDAVVTAESIDNSIDKLLSNFSIQQQIRVAKKTYKNAEKLLKSHNKHKKSFGF